MAVWVVNEWLLHDLKGENGRERQQEADRFLDELLHRCDTIVFVAGSAWGRKAYELMELSSAPFSTLRPLSKKLWSILRDAQKRLWLNQDDLKPMPKALQQTVKPNDWYLVQAQLTVNADGIVTTDSDLQQALTPHGLPVRLREELMRDWNIT